MREGRARRGAVRGRCWRTGARRRRGGGWRRRGPLLRAALGLWRGPPLTGSPPRVRGRRASRLEEERLGAVEERIAADLAPGARSSWWRAGRSRRRTRCASGCAGSSCSRSTAAAARRTRSTPTGRAREVAQRGARPSTPAPSCGALHKQVLDQDAGARRVATCGRRCSLEWPGARPRLDGGGAPSQPPSSLLARRGHRRRAHAGERRRQSDGGSRCASRSDSGRRDRSAHQHTGDARAPRERGRQGPIVAGAGACSGCSISTARR